MLTDNSMPCHSIYISFWNEIHTCLQLNHTKWHVCGNMSTQYPVMYEATVPCSHLHVSPSCVYSIIHQALIILLSAAEECSLQLQVLLIMELKNYYSLLNTICRNNLLQHVCNMHDKIGSSLNKVMHIWLGASKDLDTG